MTLPIIEGLLGPLAHKPQHFRSVGTRWVCVFFHLATIAFFPLYLSDKWERELVELVLEVSVSQVSHRQRDMLLRQVGVLLGLLDSDIIVREISAFNEHR